MNTIGYICSHITSLLMTYLIEWVDMTKK